MVFPGSSQTRVQSQAKLRTAWRWPGSRRGPRMMEVLTLAIWKTSTCLTLPSPPLT